MVATGGRGTRARPHATPRYDGGMADPTNPPGERRLSHPPADRYRGAVPEPPEPSSAVSGSGGPVLGAFAGLVGALAITVLGGLMSVTAGLIVVSTATGWAVGTLLPRRAGTAVTLALVAVALGQLGLWAYALWQGGVLGPLDLLWQVYGGLVPLELIAAAILAWIAAR